MGLAYTVATYSDVSYRKFSIYRRGQAKKRTSRLWFASTNFKISATLRIPSDFRSDCGRTTSLVNKEVIDITPQKAEFVDPLFKLWFSTFYMKR